MPRKRDPNAPDGRTKEGKAFFNTNPEQLKARINTGKILDRMHKNALGLLNPPMSAGEIKSAEALLQRVMPTLSAVNAVNENKTSYVVEMPKPVEDKDAWEQSAVTAMKALQKAKEAK